MSLERLSPSLLRFPSRIREPHGPCVGYGVVVGGEILLIDPPADLFPSHLVEAGYVQKVSRICITHAQAEHMGGIVNFPEVDLHVPQGDEYLCQGVERYKGLYRPWEEPWDWDTRGLFSGHVAGAMNERPAPLALPLAESLVPGMTVSGFTIIATPGQGKHAITLLGDVDGRRVAFCGDLIFEDGYLWNWYDCDWDYGTEIGQRMLAASCQALQSLKPEWLCPSHGSVIECPDHALFRLSANLGTVLNRETEPEPVALDFPDGPGPAEGWRQLLPHLFQWKAGNVALLLSASGHGVVIDDGLCIWEPLPERIRKHDAIFQEIKQVLGIRKIDWIIPTHYHGDHTEMIPRLAAAEGAGVLCLDSVADPMEFPERFNLACSLPWYDSAGQRLKIDHRLPEGHIWRWQEYELQFFHLGGQTRYHQGVEVSVDGRKVLIAGDAFWGTQEAAAPVLCWNDAEPVGCGWMYALTRMLEREPELLVCGHGSTLLHPLPYLRASLDAWESRLAAYDRLNPHSSRAKFFSPFFREG